MNSTCLLFFAFLLIPRNVYAETRSSHSANEFVGANIHGAVGDMGNYYLKPGGFDFHPMNNDFAGQTDKLMTGSASAGFLRNYSDSSVDVGIKWRMVTPIFKSVFGEPDLKIPIGRFADWGELEIAYARLFTMGSQLFKWQLDLGLNDVGNKGGRELHLFIHKLMGSSLNQLEYNDQPSGFSVSRGGQLGLLGENYSRWGSEFQSQYAVGLHFSKFMNEAYFQYNLILRPRSMSDNFKLGVEARSVRQIRSDVYREVNTWRRELGASLLVYKYYQPSCRFISDYVKGDSIGQLYVDFINFNVPL